MRAPGRRCRIAEADFLQEGINRFVALSKAVHDPAGQGALPFCELGTVHQRAGELSLKDNLLSVEVNALGSTKAVLLRSTAGWVMAG